MSNVCEINRGSLRTEVYVAGDGEFRNRRTAASYNDLRNILGKAIQRRIHRELGLQEARKILRSHDRSYTFRGEWFEKVVHHGDFSFSGMSRLFRMAEALGMDPILEIAKAAQERAA